MAENELPEPESVKLFEGMTGGDSDSIPTYDVIIKVRRYNPEVSSEAYWDEFPLTCTRLSGSWTAPSPSVVPVHTASAARTQCVSTVVTAWPARPC